MKKTATLWHKREKKQHARCMLRIMAEMAVLLTFIILLSLLFTMLSFKEILLAGFWPLTEQ